MSKIDYTGNNNGNVTHNGVTVRLSDQAELTNRLLPNTQRNYNDVSDGEEYDAEWMANGTTDDGRSARVYWIHTGIKGDGDTPADELDWNNVDRVEID